MNSLSLEEMHLIIKLLKKAHPMQLKSIVGYIERIIYKINESKGIY